MKKIQNLKNKIDKIRSNSIDKYKNYKFKINKNYLKKFFIEFSEKYKINYRIKSFNRKQLITQIKYIIEKPSEILTKSQDWIEKKVENKEEDSLLKQSPYWARRITWSFIGGTIFGIGWLGLAKTEEIVVVQGSLVPINQVVEVKIPTGGVVESVLVEEGQLVKQNQLLIQLNNQSTKTRFSSAKEALEINRTILDKYKVLFDEGAISELQYLNQKVRVTDQESKYIDGKLALEYDQIKSPISGKVFDLIPPGKGFVVSRSEPVLKIVPIDNLQADIEISSSSIGFVKKGMNVDISIDSFPASDFGVITGKVQSIGSDALPPDPRENKGYRFPAVIKLDTQFLEIKNGNKLPLQVGMSLTANVKLRKVSYLQLLLGTFQEKADSLREI